MLAPLLPSLLLLLLLLAASARAQGGPEPTTVNYVGDELIRMDVASPNFTRVTFVCPDPRTNGIRFTRDNSWTPGRTFYGNFEYTRGDINDLRRVRQRLGPYECITDHARNRTIYVFVLSERKHPRLLLRDYKHELHPTDTPTSYTGRCAVKSGRSGSRVVWEKYDEYNGLFVPYSTGDTFTITYDDAEKNQSVGFTMYRCYDELTPENIAYHRIMKSRDLRTRQFRTSRYESTVLPHYVKPSVMISLECKGTGAATGTRGTFRFKEKLLDNETYYTEEGNSYTTIWENYRPIRDGNPDWILQYDRSQSQVQVSRMRPLHAGRYSCLKDGVLQRTELDVDYGEVIIKDYSKKDCPLHESNNLIECTVTEKDLRSLTYFLLRLPGRTLRLTPGTTIEGYKTSLTENGIQLEFGSKPEAIGARLECNLPYTSDYTRLVEDKPGLVLTMRKDPTYLEFTCTKDREFAGTLDASVLLANGSLGEPLSKMGAATARTEKFYLYPVPSFAQVVCHTVHDGATLRSNILQHGLPDARLNIVVESDVNPEPKVFLAGRDIAIGCSFSNLPINMNPATDGYSMSKDGSLLPSYVPRSRVNRTDVQFVLRRASPADSGDYICFYNRSTTFLRSLTPLMGAFQSPTARLSICSTSQFVCDSMCRDRRLLCDKNPDCRDGTDEREEYCTKCEPNEVRCKEYRGVSPRKRCVLKHWLCDAQDDCGNGYDEDITLHRKWCYKEAICTGCKLNETCCPGPPNRKCIPRTYECDREVDCSPSEEGQCRPDQDCLRLTSPTARRTVVRRVGEPLDLTCVAVGTERPTINWRRNWAALPAAGVNETNRVVVRDFRGSYTVEGKLTFTGVTKEMAGIYNCEAVNNCKRVMSYEIELRVVD